MAILEEEEVAKLLREHRGNMASVGRSFGCSRNAVRQFIATRPALVEIKEECQESMKDDAESALYEAVLRGESWAVCFFLKTQGKNRGYCEKGDLNLGLLDTEELEHFHRLFSKATCGQY